MESTLRLPAARSLTDFANCENSLLSMVTGARAGAIFRPRRPPRVTLYGRSGRNIARGPRPRVWAGDRWEGRSPPPASNSSRPRPSRTARIEFWRRTFTLRFEGLDLRVGVDLSPDSESRGPPQGEPKGFPAGGRSSSAQARVCSILIRYSGEFWDPRL